MLVDDNSHILENLLDIFIPATSNLIVPKIMSAEMISEIWSNPPPPFLPMVDPQLQLSKGVFSSNRKIPHQKRTVKM